MGFGMLDLVFRFESLFGGRIIRARAGSRLYDSAFDLPAVAKIAGGTRAPQHPGGDRDDGPSPGGISILSGAPSPPGPLFLSPHVARLTTHSDSCPTRRLSSVGATVGRPSTSTLRTDRR